MACQSVDACHSDCVMHWARDRWAGPRSYKQTVEQERMTMQLKGNRMALSVTLKVVETFI